MGGWSVMVMILCVYKWFQILVSVCVQVRLNVYKWSLCTSDPFLCVQVIPLPLEPMHRATQGSQSFWVYIFKERLVEMVVAKPPAWFHWSFLFLVNLALFLIWHFMVSGTFVKPDASHHAAVGLIGLDTILVLSIAWLPRGLKLKKQGARIVLPSCACHVRQLCKNHNSRTGTS